MVKNMPAMREMWVRALGRNGSRKKGIATHSSILAWGSPWGRKEWDTTERLTLSLTLFKQGAALALPLRGLACRRRDPDRLGL